MKVSRFTKSSEARNLRSEAWGPKSQERMRENKTNAALSTPLGVIWIYNSFYTELKVCSLNLWLPPASKLSYKMEDAFSKGKDAFVFQNLHFHLEKVERLKKFLLNSWMYYITNTLPLLTFCLGFLFILIYWPQSAHIKQDTVYLWYSISASIFSSFSNFAP